MENMLIFKHAVIIYFYDSKNYRSYVCVCISLHRKGFSWLKRKMYVLPDMQASNIVLRELLQVKNLRLHAIDNHSRDLLASNCAKVSIKPDKAARSKRQLLKLSKTNGKSSEA